MRIKELILKYDAGIKITLLFFHFAGFSIWFGALATNQVSIAAIVVTVISGLLLVIRELIKDGLVWRATIEGICTIVKVFLLIIAFLIEAKNPVVLLIVMLLGILSAHLPNQIKNKVLFTLNNN
ncbi:MAG: hypothetical protein M1480_08665 [Bacteroidetes bacterium]|nr:hypothetical protein [Bacteroidota bacterium]